MPLTTNTGNSIFSNTTWGNNTGYLTTTNCIFNTKRSRSKKAASNKDTNTSKHRHKKSKKKNEANEAAIL